MANSIQFIARLVVACLVFTTALLAVSTFRAGLSIHTDLQSLTPHLNYPNAINQTLENSANRAAKNITVLLQSADEETLEDALDQFNELVEQTPELTFIDRSSLLQNYANLLEKHRRVILGDKQAKQLLHAQEGQLIEAAQRSLFGQQSFFRFTTIIEDPWGVVNDYILSAMSHLPQNAEDIVATESATGPRFYVIQNLVRLESRLSIDGNESAIAALREIRKKITETSPGVHIEFTGMLFFAQDTAQNARRDISIITLSSTIAVMVLFLAVFRRLRALILPTCLIALGSSVALVFCHWFFGSIHVLTIVFGASLIGVVVDYSFHYYYGFEQGNKQHNNKLYFALLFSCITSVIGYSALSLSGLITLQQVALFSAIGLVTACLTVIALGNLVVLNKPFYDRTLRLGLISALRNVQQLKFKWICLVVGVLFGFALLNNDLTLPHNDSPKALFNLNPVLVANEQRINQLQQQYETGTFVLVRGKTIQAVYDTIDKIEQALDDHRLELFGIHNLLPSPDQQQRNVKLTERLYQPDGLLAKLSQATAINFSSARNTATSEMLTPSNLTDTLGEDLPPLWLEDGDYSYSFLLIPRGAKIETLKAQLAHLADVEIVSAVAAAEIALGKLRKNALTMLLAAFALIALAMTTRFHWRKTLTLLTIPGSAILATLTIFMLFSIPVTLFHTMALFLVLGLGMDYVIFTAELPDDWQKTQCAIAMSALTSLLSFGLLSLSNLPAVSAFGFTVLIGNSINLAGCLIYAGNSLPHFSNSH